MRRAIVLDPQLARAYLSLGTVLSRQQRFSDAAAQYETALRLDPSLSGARHALTEARRDVAATQPTTTTFSKPPPAL